jgi:hypothetical protein
MKMMVSHMWIEVCWFEGFIFIFLPLWISFLHY